MKDEKKNDLPLDVVSNLEQFEGAVVNIAPIISSYYKALKDNGVPSGLAARLTIEWHNLFWGQHFQLPKGKQ